MAKFRNTSLAEKIETLEPQENLVAKNSVPQPNTQNLQGFEAYSIDTDTATSDVVIISIGVLYFSKTSNIFLNIIIIIIILRFPIETEKCLPKFLFLFILNISYLFKKSCKHHSRLMQNPIEWVFYSMVQLSIYLHQQNTFPAR